ncbi:MAG TPA: plastocyanin/azurin family copper-binding protein [Chloroflexia bacterium]|nr:plastocyanin/azurin family copper-binding protein [Chloroflexia bacterium]
MTGIANKVRKHLLRVGLTAMLMGVMAVSLAACGGDTTAPAATSPAATATTTQAPEGNGTTDGAMQEVTLKLTEWAIDPKNPEVNAGKVKFTVTNEGEFPHDAVIILEKDGKEIARTPVFTKDENPKTMEADLEAGTYTLICDVPGHAEQGMTGTLTVK